MHDHFLLGLFCPGFWFSSLVTLEKEMLPLLCGLRKLKQWALPELELDGPEVAVASMKGMCSQSSITPGRPMILPNAGVLTSRKKRVDWTLFAPSKRNDTSRACGNEVTQSAISCI